MKIVGFVLFVFIRFVRGLLFFGEGFFGIGGFGFGGLCCLAVHFGFLVLFLFG